VIRRGSKAPIDKGGWNVFGTGAVGSDGLDPTMAIRRDHPAGKASIFPCTLETRSRSVPWAYDCHLVKFGRLGDDRVVQQDEDGSELDCPQRQAGNSHWRAFSYSGRGRPSSGYRETRVTPAAWMMPITLNRSQPNCRARTARHSFEAELIRRRNLSLSSGEVAHPSRCTNLATSMTTLECDPTPISLAPSVARTANSICRPSTLVTSASPH